MAETGQATDTFSSVLKGLIVGMKIVGMKYGKTKGIILLIGQGLREGVCQEDSDDKG